MNCRKTKKVLPIFLLILLLFAQVAVQAAEKLTVVTSNFPLFDFVSQVGGEYVDVKLLLPPGVEAHGFSPSPKDIITVSHADLFLYISDMLEPWAGDIISSLGRKDGKVVEIYKETTAAGLADQDPHIWLDPLVAIEMVKVIEAALSEIDPAHSQMFAGNSAEYIKSLRAFDKKTQETLGRCQLHAIVSGGHFAFGPFARRYGLTAVSPFSGYSPDARPSPKVIAELVKMVRRTGSTVIFHEELVQPKVAKIIADETGGQLLLLHGLHNVSKKDRQDGQTYLSLMVNNVRNLAKGLRCQ